MKRDLVSIIIVNWNGIEHLKKCLPSLTGQSYKKIEIILVDNGSRDGSVDFVKKYFPKIKIIKNKKNLGFAEGNNIGYKYCNGEFILFLNNDTKVTPDFLIKLLKPLKNNPTIGGVQSKILFMDDPKRLDAVGSFLTNTGFLYHLGVYKIDSPKFNKEIDIFSAKGACMCFKRQVLEEVAINGDILDSRFFAYFEETDLCHRVWLLGYRIVYVPSSVIYHKYGATSQRLRKPFIEYHSYKNRIAAYIKNLGFINLLKILFLHLVSVQALSLVFMLRGKLTIFLSIQRAILWNILNIKETLEYRKIVQNKIRTVKDDIIFPQIVKNPGVTYYLNHLKGWNITQIDVKNKNQ